MFTLRATANHGQLLYVVSESLPKCTAGQKVCLVDADNASWLKTVFKNNQQYVKALFFIVTGSQPPLHIQNKPFKLRFHIPPQFNSIVSCRPWSGFVILLTSQWFSLCTVCAPPPISLHYSFIHATMIDDDVKSDHPTTQPSIHKAGKVHTDFTNWNVSIIQSIKNCQGPNTFLDSFSSSLLWLDWVRNNFFKLFFFFAKILVQWVYCTCVITQCNPQFSRIVQHLCFCLVIGLWQCLTF